MKTHWRRRNYFIKKELQGRYIFSFFLFVIAGSIIFTIIFSILSSHALTVVYENSRLTIGKTPNILLKEILRAHWIFIVTAGILVVISSMLLTHRFAGPIYRFERSLEEMLKGNFNFRIVLRKKDEGKELASMINEFIETMSSKIEESRRLNEEMKSGLEIAHRFSEKADPEADAKLEKAIHAQKRLDAILREFKTDDGRN